MGCMREGVDGLFNDWRRMKRARTELIGVRKRVIVLRLHCAAERALSLALDILSASVTRRRPASSSSVNLLLSLPQSGPHSLST